MMSIINEGKGSRHVLARLAFSSFEKRNSKSPYLLGRIDTKYGKYIDEQVFYRA